MKKEEYKRIGICVVALLSAQGLFGAGALWDFAPEEQVTQIDASAKRTVIDFSMYPINTIETTGDITGLKRVRIPTDIAEIAGGKIALEVISTDSLDGKQTRLGLHLAIDEAIDTSMCRALVFYYYVSEEYSRHFLGRHDLRVYMDGINFAEPAVRPGWNQFVMDFETLPSVPSAFSEFRIQIGLQLFNDLILIARVSKNVTRDFAVKLIQCSSPFNITYAPLRVIGAGAFPSFDMLTSYSQS